MLALDLANRFPERPLRPRRFVPMFVRSKRPAIGSSCAAGLDTVLSKSSTQRRFFRIRKPRNETCSRLREESRSHAQEEQMRKGVELSLVFVLVLTLQFASPRTRAQSGSKAGTPASSATSPSAETPAL